MAKCYVKWNCGEEGTVEANARALAGPAEYLCVSLLDYEAWSAENEHLRNQNESVRDQRDAWYAELQRVQGLFLSYPRDRNGWICSVCHHWNQPNEKLCTTSHIGLDTL